MLRSMTRQEWLDWQVFLSLEPLHEDREAWRSAYLVKTIWDMMRDTEKMPQPYPIERFRLLFGDEEAPVPTKKQTWQEQKQVLMQIVAAYQQEKQKVKVQR